MSETLQPRRGTKPIPALDRFNAKYEIAENGCWIWTASLGTHGYGQFGVGGRAGGMVHAHRWAYEHFVGPIPEGLELDHTCHTEAVARGECYVWLLCPHRACVNPAHLEPVTHQENMRRGATGLVSGAQQLAKTHCPYGHPYSGANLYIHPRGSRQCRACARDRDRKRRQNAAS